MKILENIRSVYFLSLFLLVILVALSDLASAQPGLPDAPEQTPIDGGLGILAAFGGAYAVHKLRNEK